MQNLSEKYFASAKPYDIKKIVDDLKQVEISQLGDSVITKYRGRIISETTVSDRYFTFDFSEFTSRLLNKIGSYVNPQRYHLTIAGGIQELRVYGEPFEFNNQKFYRMFSLISSTNKQKALQANMGLLREVCTNGMVIAVNGEHACVKAKHFKVSLPEKVDLFVKHMERMNLIYDKQLDVLNKLARKTVSFREVARKLAIDPVKNKEFNAGTQRLSNWCSTLLYSISDKIENPSYNEKRILRVPEIVLQNDDPNNDFQINAYKAFNCYIESYRDKDSSKIAAESERILDIIGV